MSISKRSAVLPLSGVLLAVSLAGALFHPETATGQPVTRAEQEQTLLDAAGALLEKRLPAEASSRRPNSPARRRCRDGRTTPT